MKKSTKVTTSQSPSFLQLSLPLDRQPFLHMRKKVRGKNRKGFDLIQEAVAYFQIALDRNEIKSIEVKAAIQDFLTFLQKAN